MSVKKILVADDHTDTRIICRELLTHYGYVVLEAEDGQQAVKQSMEHAPDLVLLDFLMPNSDARETLEQLRGQERMRDTAIVIYTAAATHAVQLHALPGVQQVLYKPVEASRLLKVVRDLFGDPEADTPEFSSQSRVAS